MTYDLKNNSGQSERREIISGERKASTYFDQQRVAQELESSGRFAKADVVTGPEAYPAGASWTRDSAGIEPPLGVRVDAMEPTGEAYEVERSLAEGDFSYDCGFHRLTSGSIDSRRPSAVRTPENSVIITGPRAFRPYSPGVGTPTPLRWNRIPRLSPGSAGGHAG